MPKRLIKFNLDFDKKDILQKFSIKQFDNAIIEISTFQDGLTYNPLGSTCKLYVGISNDALKQEANIQVQENKIVIDLDKNIIAKPGRAYAELELTDQQGVETSSTFIFTVETKLGEGATVPGGIEGFVAKYERLIKEFKTQVDNTVNNCNTRVDNKLVQLQKDYNTTKNEVVEKTDNKIVEVEKRFNQLTTSQQQDSEVIDARGDSESLKEELERIETKAKELWQSVEGSYVTVLDSIAGSIKDIEILGNTIQDANELSNIQSVGIEQEDGQVKMSILSCGKNLFDINKVLRKHYVATDGTIKPVGDTTLTSLSNFIKVEPNSNYIVGYETNRSTFISEYDKNKNFIKKNSSSMSILTSSNTKYIVLQIGFVLDNEIQNIQLEYGTQATSYEPYQESKTDILLPCKLEGLESDRDRLYYDKDEKAWCVDKPIDDILIDGTQSWSQVGVFTTDSNLVYCQTKDFDSLIKDGEGSKIVYAEKFKPLAEFSINTNTVRYDINGLCVCATYTSSKLRFAIPKSLLGDTISSTSINNYFKINPTKCKIVRKEPNKIILPLDTQIALNSFFGTTNAWIESGEVDGIIKGRVPKSLSASVNSLQDKTNKLTDRVKNIEGLQESQNLKYATNNGYLVCENTKNGVIEKLKIKGRTLVNLSNSKKYSSGNGATYEGNIFTLPKTGYASFICTENTSLQGKTLTIKYHAHLEIGENQLRATIRYVNSQNELKDIVSYIYENEFKIVVPDVEYKSILIYIQNVKDDVITQEYKITCVEGDHLDSHNEHFEGLKSVGDGVDKLEVLSCNTNKNLINIADIKSAKDDGEIIITKTGFKVDYNSTPLPVPYCTIHSMGQSYLNCYIVKKGEGGITIRGYTTLSDILTLTNYTVDKKITSLGDISTIALPSGTKYVAFHRSNSSVGQVEIANISVTKEQIPNIVTEISKKQILYYDPDDKTWKKPILREFDYIEQLSDGSYKYHVRTGQYTITGSETITSNHALASLSLQLVLENIPSDISMSESNNKCLIKADKIPAVPQVEINSNTLLVEAKRGISTRIPGNKGVYIAIEKSVCSDTEAGIEWLKKNNVIIVYPLEQEEVYECTPLNLNSYANETMVQFIGGAINPGLEFEITSHIGNMVLGNRDRINYLEDRYTESLKQILAGDMQSLAYMLYPEDFIIEDVPTLIPELY